jgi:hypothetical protein
MRVDAGYNPDESTILVAVLPTTSGQGKLRPTRRSLE